MLHPIDPVFDKDSRVLILGSFPSVKSREEGFFYGHPQNRFWKVMEGVFGENDIQSIQDKKEFLRRKRIALWDVVASCEIDGAGDSTIRNAVPNDFDRIFSAADIRHVFTTGKTAAALYKKFTGKESVVLPSPSPANCAVSLEKLIEKYKVIISYLEEK